MGGAGGRVPEGQAHARGRVISYLILSYRVAYHGAFLIAGGKCQITWVSRGCCWVFFPFPWQRKSDRCKRIDNLYVTSTTTVDTPIYIYKYPDTRPPTYTQHTMSHTPIQDPQQMFKRQSSFGVESPKAEQYNYQAELQTVGMRIRQRVDQGFTSPKAGIQSASLDPNGSVRNYAGLIVPQFKNGAEQTPFANNNSNNNNNNALNDQSQLNQPLTVNQNSNTATEQEQEPQQVSSTGKRRY